MRTKIHWNGAMGAFIWICDLVYEKCTVCDQCTQAHITKWKQNNKKEEANSLSSWYKQYCGKTLVCYLIGNFFRFLTNIHTLQISTYNEYIFSYRMIILSHKCVWTSIFFPERLQFLLLRFSGLSNPHKKKHVIQYIWIYIYIYYFEKNKRVITHPPNN